MKIKTRSVAILLGTFIPLIAFVCLSVGLILLREHADLERRLVHRHTLRAVRAIQSELRALHTLNSDWAAWDDTCAFIVDRNMAYRQANLMDETFVSMQLSLLAFLDSEGKEVWLQMFDPIHQRTAATAPEVRAFLSQAGRRFVWQTVTNQVSGLLMARPWPLLINAQPVRSSLNKEPIVGTVIMGRQMDNQFIIRVSEQTDLPISLYRVDDEELPVAARSAVRELEAALSHPRGREPPVLVRALDRERIAGHALLRDVDGRSAMLVRVEIPRDIFAQGWYATWYIGFAIAGVGLFFGLMLLFLLQKFVLGRLSNLTEAVDRIAASGNRVARVAVSGKDEITGLQREINRMLEGLERGAADLERSEHFLRRMIETSPIGIITFDAKGLLTAANPAGLKIFGVEKQDDALGYWLFEDPNIPDDIKRQVREGRTVFYEAWYEFELIHRRRLYRSSATGRIYVDAVITPMSADNGREPSGFLLQISDATRRKLVEEDLRQSYAELKRLSAHIQSVREEERTRIARQIHDELGQLLMALKIDIVWMEKRIGAGSAPLVEKMAAVRKNMDTIAEVVEKISLELRPSVLDRLGLAAAVEWQGQEFARKTGIACRVAVDLGRLELDDERATAIFRIVQEALTNVARHAQATVVGLSLRFADRTLVLEISDNGRGIPPEAIHSAESFGLVQIRERAEFCGGQADFGPGADGGTRVRVTIPIILRAAEAAAP